MIAGQARSLLSGSRQKVLRSLCLQHARTIATATQTSDAEQRAIDVVKGANKPLAEPGITPSVTDEHIRDSLRSFQVCRCGVAMQ